jgi:hypothetical protein
MSEGTRDPGKRQKMQIRKRRKRIGKISGRCVKEGQIKAWGRRKSMMETKAMIKAR